MVHFLKFLLVGATGFLINTVGLLLGVRLGMKPSLAGPAGAELAILSNFLLNNFWTFSDRRISSLGALPGKFIQFNVLSFGSVFIQFLFLRTGERLMGLVKFKEPLVEMPILSDFWLVRALQKWSIFRKIFAKFSAYLIFYIAGVGVGLVVNFTVYSQIIWK